MLLPALTGSGESVLVTDRLATVPTVVISVQLLLAAFGSVVVELAVAVLLITVPSGRAALTLTTSVNRKLVLGGSVGSVVQVTVPVPPTAGVVQPGPAPVNDTNVVPTGIASVNVTPWALLGPALLTPIV